MKIQDRWFQEESAIRLLEDIESSPDCHPVCIAPTGTGKTYIIAKLIDKFLTRYPESKILVLCDEENVLQQDYDALCNYFSDLFVGLYSAGLESKEVNKITVAGIQSVYRKSELFEECLLVIIDEAHTVNHKDVGMYRNFLRNIKANYVGLTATPFRTGAGYIYEGEGALFNKVSYDMSDPKVFKQLQDEGWLSKIHTVGTDFVMDAEKDKIKTIAGDYSEKHLSETYDREEITEICCDEMIAFARKAKRKKWLIFAIDIKHAEHIKECLIKKGIKADSVHSNKSDKKDVIKAFKNDELEAVVNVNILVKGFDETRIDFIANLRNSKSPIFHVQSNGRGLRVVYADGFDISTTEGRLAAIEAGPKQNCLVMDFTTNTDTLGPIDNVVVFKKKEKKGKSEPILKTCPECKLKNYTSVKECINCGHEFQFNVKLNIFASNASLTSTEVNNRDDLILKDWVVVKEVKYVPIYWSGKITGIKVIYITEFMDFMEEIKPHKKEYKGRVAQFWIIKRWFEKDKNIPKTPDDLWMMREFLLKPSHIFVDVHHKYKKVMDYRFIDLAIDRETNEFKRSKSL